MAGLAFSLASAASALADPFGGDASGGGGYEFAVSGPELPPPPPLPAPPAPEGSMSSGSSFGVETPLGSVDSGFQSGFDLGLPTLPPPPPPPPLPSASASGGASWGFGY